jgi:eukaryotic-like serine/threonine-protein kinase
VVAYECLAGDPPFVADQPLAIAIMHKHDPVPPLPPDVPRPIADLVYQMLAKNPQDRPDSARHVADRADVIRDARHRNGYNGPVTADLPVVPNYPPSASNFYQNDAERMPASRGGSRGVLYAGIGAAAIGVIAIVAVLLSSNNGTTPGGTNTTISPASSPAAHASSEHRASSTASSTQPGSAVSSVPPGVNVVPTKASPSKSAHPTISRSVSATATGTGSSTATSTATGTGSPPNTSTATDTTSPPATGTATDTSGPPGTSTATAAATS